MLAFIKSSFWSFLSIGSRILSALAINKLVALQFGPNGITLLSHFQNLVSVASTVPNDGINLGLIKYLAGKKPKEESYSRYFLAGVLWQFMAFLGITILLVGWQGFFLDAFLPPKPLNYWFFYFIAGLFLLLISIFFQAIFLARQALVFYTILVSLSSLGSAGLIWLFLKDLPITQLLLLYLFSQGVTAFVAILITLLKGWWPRLSWEFLDKAAFANIGNFILMALTLVICSKMVNFYVRDFIIKEFDLYQTGLWQAVVKLSDNYTMLFTSLLGTIYYPKIASLVNHPIAFKAYIKQVFYFLVPAIAAGLLLFYFLQRWFIILLFDERFLPAADLLDFQIIGDFFKMTAWLLSYIITVQGRTGFYIIIQVVAAVVYVGLLLSFVPYWGIKGVTMAHCVSFGLFLLFNLVYFRKIIF